jgi:hypothetical protein
MNGMKKDSKKGVIPSNGVSPALDDGDSQKRGITYSWKKIRNKKNCNNILKV